MLLWFDTVVVVVYCLLSVHLDCLLVLLSAATCVQRDGSNVVELGQPHDLHFQVLVVLDLGLKLRQLGVLLHELFQIRLAILLPDGVDALP